ncbi:FIVAR domain-containing protein [Xylanibacter brevis]|uniref:FIVAR domain-containing protein n=1 Tax=Xylanibacter brevis TaxID=83231 RepID=UPI0004860C17|nr:FIVAR domain-containing protein [Xylanibacter brevis]
MKRKLTFVLGLLIASLTGSVFAQSFDEQKTYSICNRNDANIFMQDNGTGKVALGSFNDKSYWKLIATTKDNCYYVQNAVTEKYMQSTASSEVEVKTGDTPVEISIILCTEEGEGMYGMASTDQNTYNFTSGTIGANWRNDNVVQGFAAVSGTNHRSFWKIEERAIPEPVTLTSPYAGSVAAEGTFFLYNVKTGKWMGDNHIKTGGDWTSHGELGPRGRDIDLKAGNAEGRFQLDPKLGNNHSINGSNLYMDTDDGVTNWIFTPVTVEGLTNCYSLTTPGGKAMGANADGWATSDAAAIAENGNIWQLVSREQRLEAMKEGDDCSWLVLGGTFPVADSHRNDNAYKTWYGEYGDNNCGGDGFYHCNQVWEFWNISQRDIYQDIAVPNGKYKFKAQAIYVSTGGNNMNADRYNEYVADPAGNTKGMVYANDVTTPMINVYSLVTDERVNDRNTKELGNGKWAYNGTNEFSTNIFEGKGWTNEIEVTVTNGTLRIGAKVEGAEAAWMLIDNFTLTYAGELDAADLTPYIEALNTAIGKAEAFNGNTTNALNTAITNALTDARAALNSEDGEEMANKATALTNAVAAAEAVDVTILQQTIAVAEQGVDLTEANDFITNGTSADVLNDILFKLRTARKINALGVADTFTGSTPTADTEYFLYNIGTGMWLANGSDWNTHAAVDIYPLGVKLIAADGGRFKMQTHMFKNREEKWINYNAYVDTNGQDTWTFNAVEGKENVYTINSEGDRTDVGRLLGYDPFGPTDKGSYRYWSNVAKDREGVDNPNNQWKLVTRAELDAKLADASKENPVDVSYLIDNGGLNRVWSLDKWNHAGGAHMSSGDDGNFDRNSDYAYEYYNTNSFSFTQELSNLVPGKYEVRVNGFFRQGNGDYQANIVNNNGELISEVYLKANSEKTFLPNIATEAGKLPGIASKETNEKGAFVNWGKEVIPAFETGLYQASVTAIVGEDGKLTIGVAQDQKTTDDSWTMFDSFRLFYLGNSIDLSELITSLNNAISEAESFDINTTSTALATTLTQALNDAKTKLISQDAEEIVAATNTLNAALNVAKLVNIEVLKATADLAKTEVDADALASVTKFLNDATTAAETAIAEATTAGAIEQALYDLTAARKINALSTTATYKGSAPAAGKVYLFNVGTGMFMGTGSDWNTHAAVDQVGIEFELVDLDTPEVNNFKFKTGRGGGWMSYKGYVDTGSQDIWHFLPVDGQEGVYNISSNGQDGFLLGYNPNKGTDGKKYWSNIGIDQTGLDNPMNQWIIVTPAERTAMIEDASEENPVDVSYLIKNASLNRQDGYDMWNKQCTGGNGGARVSTTTDGNGDRAADYAYEFFEPENFSFTQSLEGLKAGKYVVAVQGFFRNGNGDAQREAFNAGEEAVQLAYLMANDEKEFLPNITDELDLVPALTDVIKSDKGAFPNMPNAAIEYFQHGAYWTTVEVEVEEDGKLTLGVKKDERQEMGDWTVIDNFRLIYMGEIEKVDSALLAAKDSLAALIATAKAIDTTGKTSESVSALNTAISDAETALAAEDATVESLTTAKTNLQTAINNLADIVDGINAIEVAAKAGKVYNTQGQKVNKTQKGVYIINGKKTVVK